MLLGNRHLTSPFIHPTVAHPLVAIRAPVRARSGREQPRVAPLRSGLRSRDRARRFAVQCGEHPRAILGSSAHDEVAVAATWNQDFTGGHAARVAILHWRPSFTGGHTAQAAILHRWPYRTGGHIAQAAMLHRWPYCTGGHTSQVSIPHRWQYRTGCRSTRADGGLVCWLVREVHEPDLVVDGPRSRALLGDTLEFARLPCERSEVPRTLYMPITM